MTLLICLPLIVVIAGLMARRWFVATRQDIRSIESHRSNLHHLEHLTPEEASGAAGVVPPGAAHVRIVGGPGGAPRPAVRPMVWGRPDGRAPAARPAWHSARAEPVRARYAEARREVQERAPSGDQPRIVITDDAVTGLGDRPVRSDPAPAAASHMPAARPAAGPGRTTVAPTPVRPPAPETGAPVGDPPPVVITDADEATPAPAVPAPPAHRRPRRRAGSDHRRAIQVLASAAGLMVVAAGAGIAVEGMGGGNSRGTAHRVAGPSPVSARASTSTTLAPAPPPTTPPALTATSTSSTDALYTLPSGPLQVSLSAAGACWVELRSGSPTGPISYEGTLQPGSSQSFAVPGGMWLRLGDPSGVQLRINGSSVALPGGSSPFNVTVTTAA